MQKMIAILNKRRTSERDLTQYSPSLFYVFFLPLFCFSLSPFYLLSLFFLNEREKGMSFFRAKSECCQFVPHFLGPSRRLSSSSLWHGSMLNKRHPPRFGVNQITEPWASWFVSQYFPIRDWTGLTTIGNFHPLSVFSQIGDWAGLIGLGVFIH